MTTNNRRASSLRTKAIVLLVLVAAVPASIVALLLAGASRDAVETSERQLQAAVIAELSRSTQRAVDSIREDAEAVASALSFAAAEPGQNGLGAVRSLLATRRAIDAVRFEVPSANVSTVLAREGVTSTALPSSTVELRTAADGRGVGFALTDAGVGTLVVPVPALSP
ncbi:MAG TPA: hypothetical protein VEQ58_10620, partial [Polyangiaceae bacterium]|nr:hypothetical protein [Polyangiaceae bacterium]